MPKFVRNILFYMLVVVVLVGLINMLATQGRAPNEKPYSYFREMLLADQIKSLSLREEGPTGQTVVIEATLKAAPAGQEHFITRAPLTGELMRLIDEKIDQSKLTVVQERVRDTSWVNFLISVVPFVLIFILFFFLINQAQGGGNRVMNFGKARIRQFTDDKRKVTFKDVAGADEEKAELVEIVDFLKDPRKYAALGARIPKGVLLVGPPGTGKTLLARAVAGEAGVPFFSISGSDFVEMFVGVGASRVRDLFETAKKNAPCIVFIDEIDAVGRMRGAGLGGGHDEREQTLNQLLVEMDGFQPNEGIIVMAATNRPDILDPALLRPGRFDRQITVDRPDVKGREEILKVHARNKPLEPEVDLKVIARRTPGFTGADLENLLNEAALLAARRNKKAIGLAEIDEAIDRVIAGPAKTSRVISEREKQIVAYHESGHVIAGYYATNGDEVHKVTIIPRGQAGGYAVTLPKDDTNLPTKSYLLDRILILLAGRVAEEIVFGDVSTGAYSDFKQATDIARRMVMEYGMSEKLGPMQFGRRQGEVFLGRDLGHEQNYSDAIAYEIDLEIQRIIREQYERCRQLLTDKREKLETIAQALLRVETLTSQEIRDLIEKGRTEGDRIVAEPISPTEVRIRVAEAPSPA
ncbi:ATP-dependent zinc metalloprotease FtsH [Hydrogenibacillus sp. N12]|uniref:ATP-dependent zinc metalloprotease FtsH n=1 Tax=Hydrogenibacillus sp. N12 TaxID=2866627 RepID=UPI001C7D1CB4|nr:ATP-dependent zinc metalloprotease FtsH [Hydrogenibacillus sp. N12]QZA33084.1 ATP-dependent zinc metalloprotease FtsH [Hydrogenibacillus sp. N12]